MLASIVCSALAFSAPPSATVSRRDALMASMGAASVFGAAPVAFAEMYGDGKAADKSQGASARQLKFAKNGEETEAFKQAEAKRAEAERRFASGAKAKEETAEEAMARLGLKTYK